MAVNCVSCLFFTVRQVGPEDGANQVMGRLQVVCVSPKSPLSCVYLPVACPSPERKAESPLHIAAMQGQWCLPDGVDSGVPRKSSYECRVTQLGTAAWGSRTLRPGGLTWWLSLMISKKKSTSSASQPQYL